MVYYRPVKVIINVLSLAEVIINIVVKYQNFLNLIVIK